MLQVPSFMLLRFLLLVACASAGGIGLPACSREPRRSTESTAQDRPVAKKQATPAPGDVATPLDWRRYRAYQALPSHVGPGEDYCSAQTALETATQKLWRLDGPTRVELVSEGPPRGYANFWHDGCLARTVMGDITNSVTPTAYQTPSDGGFSRLVAPTTSVYWMSEEGKQCVRVDVRAFQRPRLREKRDPAHSNPSVEAFASVPVPEAAIWGRLVPESEPHSFIPFVALGPRPRHLGYLLMGTWQRDDGKPLLKCQCERLLRIMRIDDGEIHMLPRRLPGDPDPKGSTVREPPKIADEISYYDSGEVERWFWDAASCDRARIDANAKIAGDGHLSVRSGFYSGYSELD